MTNLTKDMLLSLGFVEIAAWRQFEDEITYQLDGPRSEANKLLLDESNALYAFVHEEAVKYIGKTTQSIKTRFIGYRKPGKGQKTNVRCNAKIKDAIKVGAEIRILVFTPISNLRYLEFEINLAAGLEDSLIKAFNPPWNGREKNRPVSEEAEREETEEDLDARAAGIEEPAVLTATGAGGSPIATFNIRLGQAYYWHGLINPGVNASDHLGADGEPIQVLFEDGTEPVLSRINRTANYGAVRVVGRNRQIADWLQKHFQIGDIVEARVLDANRILLMLSDTRHAEFS